MKQHFYEIEVQLNESSKDDEPMFILYKNEKKIVQSWHWDTFCESFQEKIIKDLLK